MSSLSLSLSIAPLQPSLSNCPSFSPPLSLHLFLSLFPCANISLLCLSIYPSLPLSLFFVDSTLIYRLFISSMRQLAVSARGPEAGCAPNTQDMYELQVRKETEGGGEKILLLPAATQAHRLVFLRAPGTNKLHGTQNPCKSLSRTSRTPLAFPARTRTSIQTRWSSPHVHALRHTHTVICKPLTKLHIAGYPT